MAASWTDANLRNHVSRSTNNRFDNFFETFSFTDESTKKYSPYILKDLYSSPNIKYNEIDNNKFDKYNIILQDKAPRYNFGSLHSNKPMYDAYYAFGKIFLYQLILACNNIWNLLDYNDDNLKKVLVPTKQNIQDLYKNLLQAKHYRTIRELIKVDDIENAIKSIIVNSEIDYGIVDAIHEKLNISYYQINRRLKSPLIVKFLSKQLYQLINKTDEEKIDDELLTDTLNSILKRVTKFIADNRIDED